MLAGNAEQRDFLAVVEVFSPKPSQAPNLGKTEVRLGTVHGCGGHYQCRRIPVTLPYSGTLQ